MKPNSLSIIILAAGKGTRMKSDKAKVLHTTYFQPMVAHVIDAAKPLSPSKIIVVVGHQRKAVETAVGHLDIEFAVQTEQLGTGHAVLAAESVIDDYTDTVMILYGDTPLLRSETLETMYESHIESESDVTIMTTLLDDPTNYGRVICNTDNNITEIVEQKDGTPEQLEIREINTGIYCVNKNILFSTLRCVGTDNSQKEVYLNDIVRLAAEKNLKVNRFLTKDTIHVLGVNSRVELAAAQNELQLRQNREFMLQGISMSNPETILISPDSTIGQDTDIGPGVNIINNSTIGKCCSIGQGTFLLNCTIGNNVKIGPYCYLNNKSIEDNCIIEPHST